MAGVNDLPNAYLLPAIIFLSYHSLKYVSKETSSRTSTWACWDILPAGRPGRGQKDGHLLPRGTHHWTGACHQPQISLQISKLAFANLMQKGQCSLLERWRESSMGRYYLVMDQFFRKVINLSTPGSPLKKTLASILLMLQGFSHLRCQEDSGIISAVCWNRLWTLLSQPEESSSFLGYSDFPICQNDEE